MDNLKKELAAVEKREKKLLGCGLKKNKLKESIYERVPEKVSGLLEAAFTKAFKTVFVNGTGLIEKTFDKESAGLEFEAGDYIVERARSKKSLRRMDKQAKKDNLLNNAATTAAGLGLGFLGLGLPDIPLMVGTILKGVYEIAIGYGFHYDTEQEKIYILRLICTALADEEEKADCNRRLECRDCGEASLEAEINRTAAMLSDALLVEKFVQGLPVVGAIGGVVNWSIYRRVSALAAVKYKKRYLRRKLGEAVDGRE